MKAGANLQQRADAAMYHGASCGGLGDAREEFEQRAFAGSVAADNAHGLAVLDLERDVLERPDIACCRLSPTRSAQPAYRRSERPHHRFSEVAVGLGRPRADA